MTDKLDLPRRYRDQLEALLWEHVPDAEVWAYGSRVNGKSHDGSDLDIVLRSPTLEPLGDGYLDLIDALEQSNIPILVQAHDWARLPESFHQEIERDYVVLQKGGVESAVRTDWKTTILGHVADIIMGQSPSGDTSVTGSSGLRSSKRRPTEIRPAPFLLPVGNVTTDSRKRAQPGDLLFCVRGFDHWPHELGRMEEYAIGRGVAAIRSTGKK